MADLVARNTSKLGGVKPIVVGIEPDVPVSAAMCAVSVNTGCNGNGIIRQAFVEEPDVNALGVDRIDEIDS